jgi:hypothetical protein
MPMACMEPEGDSGLITTGRPQDIIDVDELQKNQNLKNRKYPKLKPPPNYFQH